VHDALQSSGLMDLLPYEGAQALCFIYERNSHC
jgi:hypothetical protein